MRVNSKQQKTLIAGALFVFAMLIYPPFMHEVKMSGADSGVVSMWVFDGFDFIFYAGNRSINIPQLLTQWIGVALITFLLKMALTDEEETA